MDAFADDVQVLEARRQLAHRRADLVHTQALLQHDDGEVAIGRVHHDAVRPVAERLGGCGERFGADLVARRAEADDESIVEARARAHLALVLVAVRHELEGDRRAVEVGRAAHDRRRGLVVGALRELVRVAEAAEGREVRAELGGAFADFARGANFGGGGYIRIGAALDELFAVVEQVAVGAVLEQDLERLGGGRGLDDAGENAPSVFLGNEVEGRFQRRVEREARGRVRVEQDRERFRTGPGRRREMQRGHAAGVDRRSHGRRVRLDKDHERRVERERGRRVQREPPVEAVREIGWLEKSRKVPAVAL